MDFEEPEEQHDEIFEPAVEHQEQEPPEVMADNMMQAFMDAFEAVAIRPKKETPRFTGKENPNYFILSFRLATEGLEDAQRHAVFRQSMQGAAYSWYCGMRLSDETTGIEASIEDWEARLKAAFGKTQGATLDELEGRKQTESEAPADYVRDILRLCSEVDPSMSEAMRVRHLQRGLLTKYQREMMLMDPADTTAFQAKLVKLASSAPPAAASDSSDRALLSTLVAHLVSKETTTAPVLAVTAAPAAKTTKVEDVLAQLVEKLASMESRINERRNNQRRTPNPNSGCFACGEKGHIARNCPVKPAEKASENSGARS